MKKFKSLLIHADPQVRSDLRKLLRETEEIKILGEALTCFEAMELLEAIPYDVFFLGVDLPGGVSGIELAQMLVKRKDKPALVFVAPDESMAYKGFELGALDYLLWPCSRERIGMTVSRINQRTPRERMEVSPRGWDKAGIEDEEETVHLNLGDEEEETLLKALSHAWESAKSRSPEIEKLAINQDGRMILVPYTGIVFIEAYEDYSYVHTSSQKYLTSYRLKNLEDRLRQHRFFRVHRKYLVNLEMVTEIASLPGSNFMLRTAGKKRIELPISRRRISELKDILGL
ncbi:MAG: LytR/AlgR family response regulator transcription factor [Desulfovibrionales bacterium]